ncbi:hypothetical protein M231_04792 [Tremella mesenterica]|uniref:Uncharacterized protein n=1 Tax=Tremella mesenterica TaxID=5217 RepID=A0A4Q1BJM1_TREME|nr:uncharacterized protein TREMEDRAFT_64434 [Tremella mesenterica DSM 1558]EIW67194.1 hypothetical protein TREMEDRAFT_64434 [Tremella mesenterica DSM 1558]RXK37903.1 hypothetical protein M231_04792 [Tremella mesenterica]
MLPVSSVTLRRVTTRHFPPTILSIVRGVSDFHAKDINGTSLKPSSKPFQNTRPLTVPKLLNERETLKAQKKENTKEGDNVTRAVLDSSDLSSSTLGSPVKNVSSVLAGDTKIKKKKKRGNTVTTTPGVPQTTPTPTIYSVNDSILSELNGESDRPNATDAMKISNVPKPIIELQPSIPAVSPTNVPSSKTPPSSKKPSPSVNTAAKSITKTSPEKTKPTVHRSSQPAKNAPSLASKSHPAPHLVSQVIPVPRKPTTVASQKAKKSGDGVGDLVPSPWSSIITHLISHTPSTTFPTTTKTPTKLLLRHNQTHQSNKSQDEGASTTPQSRPSILPTSDHSGCIPSHWGWESPTTSRSSSPILPDLQDQKLLSIVLNPQEGIELMRLALIGDVLVNLFATLSVDRYTSTTSVVATFRTQLITNRTLSHLLVSTPLFSNIPLLPTSHNSTITLPTSSCSSAPISSTKSSSSTSKMKESSSTLVSVKDKPLPSILSQKHAGSIFEAYVGAAFLDSIHRNTQSEFYGDMLNMFDLSYWPTLADQVKSAEKSAATARTQAKGKELGKKTLKEVISVMKEEAKRETLSTPVSVEKSKQAPIQKVQESQNNSPGVVQVDTASRFREWWGYITDDMWRLAKSDISIPPAERSAGKDSSQDTKSTLSQFGGEANIPECEVNPAKSLEEKGSLLVSERQSEYGQADLKSCEDHSHVPSIGSAGSKKEVAQDTKSTNGPVFSTEPQSSNPHDLSSPSRSSPTDRLLHLPTVTPTMKPPIHLPSLLSRSGTQNSLPQSTTLSSPSEMIAPSLSQPTATSKERSSKPRSVSQIKTPSTNSPSDTSPKTTSPTTPPSPSVTIPGRSQPTISSSLSPLPLNETSSMTNTHFKSPKSSLTSQSSTCALSVSSINKQINSLIKDKETSHKRHTEMISRRMQNLQSVQSTCSKATKHRLKQAVDQAQKKLKVKMKDMDKLIDAKRRELREMEKREMDVDVGLLSNSRELRKGSITL